MTSGTATSSEVEVARGPLLPLRGYLPVAILVVTAGVAAAGRGGFKDLLVYQYGGHAALHGLAVYRSDDPVTGLPFTYPPFAAAAMAPLSLLPPWLAAALWTAASLAALAGAVVVVRRALGRSTSGWLLALVCAGALLVEPVWQTLTFGQINLLVMLAILVDLLHPQRRWSGVLVGVAAAVKLTPLVFVLLLLLIGRRAAGVRAALTFLGTVAVGFVLMPSSSLTYWTDGLFNAGRVGPPELAHNQSVYGALTRVLDGRPSTLVWLLVAGPLSVAVLMVGAARCRRGELVLGTCIAAMAMLLASPVSWSHHWVWAVPVALALWERSRAGAVAWIVVFMVRPFVWLPYGRGREYAWTAAEHVVGNAYLLAALVVCARYAYSGYSRWRPVPRASGSTVP